MSTSWASSLSPQEYKYYMQLFQSVSKTQEGIITGIEAVNFFATSGVPTQILSEIWEAADSGKVGYLTPETFSVALKLIACAQHGKEAKEPILSTAVPLPQFDGTPVITQSPAIASTPLSQSQSSVYNMPITPAECEKYSNIFKIHQPTHGVLDADTAKRVFLKSKLPLDVLSQIWYLADVRQSGSLNQTEFIIAMHYIAKLMDGTLTSLPDKLSPAVLQSASEGIAQKSPLLRSNTASIASPRYNIRQTMTPPQRARKIESLGSLAFGQETVWDVTPAEKQQFDAYFDRLDTKKTGIIQGKEAVEFFKNSQLPETELAHVWDLSDIQQRGVLSRDEFAIAMHLIHKRINGETLPASLPTSLLPPQSQTQQSPFIRSPRTLLDDSTQHDLLGDFDNEQISHETNQVNLIQNQVKSFVAQTADVAGQKMTAEKELEQLLQQKKQLESQMTAVRMTYETEFKSLTELQDTIRKEEAEWVQIKNEYAVTEQQLNEVQSEIAQIEQTIQNGRKETDTLRRRIAEIQAETQQANVDLEGLRSQLKQQNMMLDINRRQVTAAEQDRSEAKRNLEEYKTSHEIDSDSEEDKSEENIFNDSPNAFNLFESPPVSETESIQAPENDFDAIFGTVHSSSPFHTPSPTSAFAGFDSPSWTSPLSKQSRAPPPPPPQNKHIRHPSSGSFSSINTNNTTNTTNTTNTAKKTRAPPPPPPVTTNSNAGTDTVDDDDFEAAFSGKLPEAKVITQEDTDDFSGFDDAFKSMDIAPTQKPHEDTPTSWTSSLGGFGFPSNPKSTSDADQKSPDPSMDWDSIFGTVSSPTESKTDPKQPTSFGGFDDAFSSFNDDFGTPKSTPKPTASIGIVGNKIQDLVKMGFAEQEAKDALNRYDQDLEKATNFLLDQSK